MRTKTTTSVHYRFRPGSEWNIDDMQWREGEYATGEFELMLLRAIQNERDVYCGGCRRRFTRTADVALITQWITEPGVEPMRIEINGYCLDCADRHGEEILTHARSDTWIQ
jgi:hypothetical protein